MKWTSKGCLMVVNATTVHLKKIIMKNSQIFEEDYMHTPAWLLMIVNAYLSDKSMYLTYNRAQSSKKMLPGGGVALRRRIWADLFS